MTTNMVGAVDAILGTLKIKWDADSPAINGGSAPTMVYEPTERDLRPHPKDSTAAWARAVIRHADAIKATLNNSDGLARYRRMGLVWVQVFVPFTDGSAYTKAQQLATIAQKAYEGKRASGGDVVFTKAVVLDKGADGPWCRFDCRINFYWDELHS